MKREKQENYNQIVKKRSKKTKFLESAGVTDEIKMFREIKFYPSYIKMM